MSDFTAGLALPFILGGVGGGVLHNEALAVLDAVYGKGVEGILNDAPASPNDQEAWVVGTPTFDNEWDTHDGKIAVWFNGAWRFYEAAQGVRTYNRATNCALVKGSAGWHHAVGQAAWFARLNTAFTYSGTSSNSVNGWTNMIEQPGSGALWDHNPPNGGGSDDGRLEFEEGGLYIARFSGVIIPKVAADTYRVGFGVNSANLTLGGYQQWAFTAASLNRPHGFCVEMIRTFSASNDLYVTCDKTTGDSGTLEFVDESCKWTVLKLSP